MVRYLILVILIIFIIGLGLFWMFSLMMIRIGIIYFVFIFIEYLKSKEIYTLLDEVHISEMFQMQYKFYDCSERHFLVLLIRY